jgi:DNA polymerase-3 subunit delta
MVQTREGSVLYILWGADEFSQEEKLGEIKAGLGESSMLSSNTHLLDGQKLSVEELAAVAEAAPFLSSVRLIVIRGLLERFEAKGKTNPPRKATSTKADESALFANCLNGLPPSSLVVMIDKIESKDFVKNNPLFQSLAPKAHVLAFGALSNPQLFQWVQDRVVQKGGSISRQATQVLIELIGCDLFTLNNEIDKLIAYTAGRLIEEKDIRSLVSAAQETRVFALADAILEKKSARSENILDDLLKNGLVPSQILDNLARQVQIMLKIKEMKSQRKSSGEIQKIMGIISPYAWSKASGRADKFSMPMLKDFYRKLLEADLSIKTGRFEGDLALNLLVAELSQG